MKVSNSLLRFWGFEETKPFLHLSLSHFFATHRTHKFPTEDEINKSAFSNNPERIEHE